MNNDLISVIVPIYKAESYLRKCIESILAQTYTNIEVILINDGSPDSCGAICDEYAEKEGRVAVIHKENGGVSKARNYGLKRAAGRYVTFVDSDDEVEPDFIKKLIEKAWDTNAQVIVCGVGHVFLDEVPVRIVDNCAYDADCSTASEKYVSLESAGIFNLVWNKLYDVGIIKEFSIMFKDIYGEDFDFNLNYFMKIESIAIVEETLYRYNKRNIDSLVTRYYPNLLGQLLLHNSGRRALFGKFALSSDENRKLLANLCCDYIGAGILNLFNKNSQETMNSKLEVIKCIYSDNDIFEDMKLFSPRNMVQRILKITYCSKSPHVMLLTYTLLFFLRHSFSGVYLKVRKRFVLNNM